MSDSPQPAPLPVAPRKRRWLRILLIFLAVLAVCLSLLFGCVYMATKPAVNAADAFFATTAKQGPDASYSLASPAFRASIPPQGWAEFARSNALLTYQSASWSSRDVANGTAELKGSLHLQGGATLPLSVNLTHDTDGSWRVLSIHLAIAGVDQSAQSAPSLITGETGAAPTGAPVQSGGTSNAIPGGLPDLSAGPAPASTPNSLPGAGAGQAPQAPPVNMPQPAASLPAPPAANATGLEAMMVPAAKVAGICQQTFTEQYRLAFSGSDCFQGLPTAPGGSTRCTTTDPRTGARTGFTAIDQRFDPVSQHVDVSCILDRP
jgi:hypothetical protein